MFTGLVQAVGQIVSTGAEPSQTGAMPSPLLSPGKPLRLMVDAGSWNHRPELGDSISVSGCCLTVAQPIDAASWEAGLRRMAFDVIPETLAKTCLGAVLGRNDPTRRRVNLEHAVTASTLMGGHFVQGHVDGVGRVERIDTADGHRVRVRPPAELMPYLVPKGSICVDGVSLTIAALGHDGGNASAVPSWFEVALIPATLAMTTLADLNEGDPVNLEADVLAKTIVHYLRHFQAGSASAALAPGL